MNCLNLYNVLVFLIVARFGILECRLLNDIADENERIRSIERLIAKHDLRRTGFRDPGRIVKPQVIVTDYTVKTKEDIKKMLMDALDKRAKEIEKEFNKKP